VNVPIKTNIDPGYFLTFSLMSQSQQMLADLSLDQICCLNQHVFPKSISTPLAITATTVLLVSPWP